MSFESIGFNLPMRNIKIVLSELPQPRPNCFNLPMRNIKVKAAKENKHFFGGGNLPMRNIKMKAPKKFSFAAFWF